MIWLVRIMLFLVLRLAIMFWPVTLAAGAYIWFVYF